MPRRLAVLPAALALALAACGGGPRHIEEITPVVSLRLSGTWVLDEGESDDPEEALAAPPAQAGRRPGGAGQPPMGGRGGGVAGRGGTPGGGMGGARPRQGPGGRMDLEAARTLRRLATMAPRTLELTLADSLVALATPGDDPWLLPFGEDVTRKLDGGVEVKARAEWENGRVVVTRSVDGGGSVRETFMPSVDGRRLTVAVEVSMGGRGGAEFRRVYTQPGDDGGS